MTGEEERQREEARREWLGDPIPHGGGYRPSEGPGWVGDIGCCLFELLASFSIVLAVAGATLFHLMS